jgi:hypothetical protein
MASAAEPEPLATFASLPCALALAVFARLPADARLRCAEVHPSWQLAVAERSLWLRLDLSPASGGLARPTTDALLHAAAARAGGGLQSLDVTDCTEITYEALRAVAAANAGALHELRASRGRLWPGRVEALLLAAPHLRTLEVSLHGFLDQARRFLRNHPPFGPVRVRHLSVYGDDSGEGEDDVLMLSADMMSAHVGLMALALTRIPLNTPVALDAVVDAALARRVSSLELDGCGLSPASAPALARLLGGGALTALSIDNRFVRMLDDTFVALLCDALRASSTLTSLSLTELSNEPNAAAALLGALTGHRSLQTLHVRAFFADAGAALAELVAANAPSLVDLDVSNCRLGDVGLGPLFDALPHNTHLRTLRCWPNDFTEAFVRDRLLPAVRANSSLRLLEMGMASMFWPEAREAETLVAARTVGAADG